MKKFGPLKKSDSGREYRSNNYRAWIGAGLFILSGVNFLILGLSYVNWLTITDWRPFFWAGNSAICIAGAITAISADEYDLTKIKEGEYDDRKN